MAEDEGLDPRTSHCQALPAAARRGFREDALCASSAKTHVAFRGGYVAVCRMHEATYLRWGDDAESNAQTLWGWQTVDD